MTAADPWADLRRHTAARIALGRAGASLPTAQWLRFAQAHALARDAVHEPFDSAKLAASLQAQAFETVTLESAAADRAVYLRRPDLGRRLSERSAQLLADVHRCVGGRQGGSVGDADAGQGADGCDVAIVIGDGLSARAAHAHAVPLLLELRPQLEAQGVSIGPLALVHQCRVALGDEVGAALQARMLLMLIGERPGLSSPDSLGAYLTWAPCPGLADAQRNCVSNIRPEGLSYPEAAARIAWLLAAARRLGATGVALKDESPVAVGGPRPRATLD